MISRNQIRQAVVQLLYGLGLDPSEPASVARLDAMWEMMLEPQRASLGKSTAKAVEHITRDYPARHELFDGQAHAALSRWQGDPSTDSLRDRLNDLLSREKVFAADLQAVRSARKNDPEGESGQLSISLDALDRVNEALIQLRSRFLDMLQDHPRCAGQSSQLIKTVKRLQAVGELLSGLFRPENCDHKAEIRNVIELKGDIADLRREADAMLTDILNKCGELDTLINSVVEHYASERVSPIERAIIRIAAYELKYRDQLPTPVIASEAIRLAERYSITQAPRFINGLVAGIAAICRNEGPTAQQ